jgi:RimJ/RimL family protein N-acetyltransferase
MPEQRVPELHTARTRLGAWRQADREPFAALNADPVVMEHFPATLSRVESDAFADRAEATLQERGWGLWAVEVEGGGGFAGFVGLNEAVFEAPFTPAVEIGWRLARAFWNRGLATEAALAVADHAFGVLGMEELVSFTATSNLASRRVMEKIGMQYDPAGDFDHPRIAVGHPLRRHVLYRLRNPAGGSGRRTSPAAPS